MKQNKNSKASPEKPASQAENKKISGDHSKNRLRDGQARVTSEAFNLADQYCQKKSQLKTQYIENARANSPEALLAANVELTTLAAEAKYLSLQLNSLKSISIELNKLIKRT